MEILMALIVKQFGLFVHPNPSYNAPEVRHNGHTIHVGPSYITITLVVSRAGSTVGFCSDRPQLQHLDIRLWTRVKVEIFQ